MASHCNFKIMEDPVFLSHRIIIWFKFAISLLRQFDYITISAMAFI